MQDSVVLKRASSSSARGICIGVELQYRQSYCQLNASDILIVNVVAEWIYIAIKYNKKNRPKAANMSKGNDIKIKLIHFSCTLIKQSDTTLTNVNDTIMQN